MARVIPPVGIVGSGVMGCGLAEVAARAGYDVVVCSRSQASADAVRHAVDCGVSKAIDRGKATVEQRDEILARIVASEGLSALAGCDLVIESVIEDIDVKLAMFAELSQVTKRSAILATNTSTL